MYPREWSAVCRVDQKIYPVIRPLCMYVCMYNFAIQINKITIYDKKGKKTKVKSIYNNTKFTDRRKKAK